MSEMAVPVMGVEEARERFARLRVLAERAAPDYIALYEGRAWVALGYSSWEEAIDTEIGGLRLALPRDGRREAVAQMRGAGMSNRMIGTALGVSEPTVRRDLVATASDDAVDVVVGLDGRQRPAHVIITTRTTEATKVEQDVDLDTGEILERPTPVTLPPIPRDHERERLVAQMTRLVRAITDLDGLPDPVARARYAREWDPSLSDANPSNATPDHMRAIASGLLAFADELEATRELRVV